jgi:DNA-binding LytR/AlgR family response regulator
MKKINYIIAEDRQEHIEALQKAIQKTRYNADLYLSDILECVAICTNGLQTWMALQTNPTVELLFLDYDMPEMTGKSLLEVLKDRANPPFVIIVSNYFEEALDLVTFYTNVVAPIAKPVTPQRLTGAMNKVIPLIWGKKKTFIEIFHTVDRRRASHRFDTDDIVYIEAQNRNVTILFANQAFKRYEKLVSNADYHSLTQLIMELPVNDFYRVNHSYIMNRNYIKSILANDIQMQDDKLIATPPQGTYNREAFLKWYK